MVNEVFANLAASYAKKDEAKEEEAKAQEDQANFLSRVLGHTDEDTPQYTEAEAQAAVEAEHNKWKEENNA